MTKSIYDWIFGDPKESYARARANVERTSAAPTRQAAASALDGPDAFLLGTLRDGTPLKLDPSRIQGHGMVWGANGAGKSYGLDILMEGFAKQGRRVSHVDPKGESILIAALSAANSYAELPEEEREAFAARFRVIDVREDRLTPANLFAVPPGMSPYALT